MWVQDSRIAALEAAAGATPPTDAEREAKALAFVHRIFAPLREPNRTTSIFFLVSGQI